MTRRAWVLAGLIALVVAGCGGSDEPSTEDEARDVAERWNEALAAGDGATACSLMTTESVAEIERPFRPELSPEDLPQPIRRHLEGIGHPRQECEEVHSDGHRFGVLGAVTVDGDHAVAEFTDIGADDSATTAELPLVLERGEWRVDLVGFVEGLDFSGID
jgi:hypothetical protein